MVGLLPFVPPFLKACTRLTKTHISSTSQRFKSSQYSSLEYQKQGSRVNDNDNLEIELTSHAQKPGLEDARTSAHHHHRLARDY